jgi:hypothetical protein
MPPPIDDTVNSDRNDEHDATSCNPLITNPAKLPVTPDPNHPETRASNANQHPGQLHNAYTGKRRTKKEMVEVRRIEAEEKAKMAAEAERRATKYKESMRLVAEYEENLAKMDIDNTPITYAGRQELPVDVDSNPSESMFA